MSLENVTTIEISVMEAQAAIAVAAAERASQQVVNNQETIDQTEETLSELLATAGVDPDFISYTTGVLPDSTGAIVGTIGAYYNSNGSLQKLEWDGANWVEIGTPLAEQDLNFRSQPFGGSIEQDNIVCGFEGNDVASDLGACTISGGGTLNRENIIGGDPAQRGTINSPNNTPRVPQTGTGADYSVITGGYDNIAGSLASIINGFHNATGLTASHGTVGGGSWNEVADGDYSTIVGGHQNTVSGDNDTVGGRENVLTGDSSTVFGFDNTVTGDGHTVGGTLHTVNAAAVLAAGQQHDLSGNYSVATGRQAKTRTWGQKTHASGFFSVQGDAQESIILLRRETTNATQATLGVSGSSTTHFLEANQTVAFKIMLMAREATTTDSKYWEVSGLCKWTGSGSVTFVGGTPTFTVIDEDTGASAWVAVLVGGTGSFQVRVTGEAGKTIRWQAKLELLELTF